MNSAIEQMLETYKCRTTDDYVGAVREILQRIALLGLWRSKFFEHAAFYGGTALRVLYGLDRYSEDLDFSLLEPDSSFSLESYGDALLRELSSFGFDVSFERGVKKKRSAIESAFLKANTLQQMIVVRGRPEGKWKQHSMEMLRIKLEVDTDPPAGFQTESRSLLLPIPFAVRTYALPDLFAGKMHALLCRKWGNRVKGRDWYDLVWYIGHHPQLHLQHLESRMRYSGDWPDDKALSRSALMKLLQDTICKVDLTRARQEVGRFVRDKESLELWSREFFMEIIERIEVV
jgi:predicted nucleotidyltransferase component of viral defense system